MKFNLVSLIFIFPIIGFAQNNSVTPQIIEQVCKNSETDAINSLATLSARTNNFRDLTLEKIRNSYVESMNDERERIKSIVNTPTYQIILDSSDANFKYALCQKLNRPSTTTSVIASELYFLCRRVFSTGKEQKPEACF
jgi:transcription initiation factor TFIIIB Brf1 subunit/transcription initiation factor TFIIB